MKGTCWVSVLVQHSNLSRHQSGLKNSGSQSVPCGALPCGPRHTLGPGRRKRLHGNTAAPTRLSPSSLHRERFQGPSDGGGIAGAAARLQPSPIRPDVREIRENMKQRPVVSSSLTALGNGTIVTNMSVRLTCKERTGAIFQGVSTFRILSFISE